ncbi:MAG: ATP-dependent Clp protease proteolytic subunit [Opitutales bacterium]
MRRPVLPVLLLLSMGLSAQQSPRPPEVVKAELETEAIRARLDLAAAKRRLESLPGSLELRGLEAEALLRKARADAVATGDDAEKDRIKLELGASAARAAAASVDKDRARAELEVEARLAAAEASVELAKVASAAQIVMLEKKVAEVAAGARTEHPEEPFVDGVLRVSDRRIPFNGRVTSQLAEYVCARIAFYNAVDPKAPIFLIIDRNPGGSVMSGYQILQAMEASKAPVYVVVKGYAASMAAIITTLAKRSFVYPQAIVLHHQASSGLGGNLTQLNEQLKWSKLWVERIFVKVADRVGVPLDDFVKQMYANASTGDWKVLGDEAVRRRWATDVVQQIKEESFNVAGVVPPPAPLDPDVFGNARPASDGRVREFLPPAEAGDAWWIHDPSVEFVLR